MAGDKNWRGFNLAIGESDGEAMLNVAEVAEVSSLLRATGVATTTEWKTERTVTVAKRSLDSLLPEILDPTAGAAYLKLDIQGYESAALDGAFRSLGRFDAIEMEMSTIPLYEGESLFPSLTMRMSDAGFDLFSLETVLVDYIKGRVLQVEGLFVSRGSVSS
jgi:FkbM family methyltransferase